MKRIVIALLALFASCMAFGQTELAQTLLGKLNTHKVSFSYSCTVNLDVPMKSSGTITAQQNSYRLTTAGMDIYCDGTTRWTVDTATKEVYIENATGLREYLADTQRYLDNLSDIELSDVKVEPVDTREGIFRFDEKSLDSSWVVTDLR
ncbi:MAG: hypothetical protein MJY41_01195 [Bacteroidales bacterium]|nr:hypothetical protein [Bacteroidales bacterium]